MLNELDRADRLQLMKFVCSFAWADLEIHRKERAFVRDLVQRLEFELEDTGSVWATEVIDPAILENDANDLRAAVLGLLSIKRADRKNKAGFVGRGEVGQAAGRSGRTYCG